MGTKVCDTRCQMFQKEVATKEEALRMKWFLQNQQRLLDNLGKEKSKKKGDVVLDLSKILKPAAKKEGSDQVEKSKDSRPWREKHPDGSLNLDTMKSLDPKVKQLLYEPEVESFIAKNRYFYRRYQDKPEDRFYFPLCSSWIYGWRFNDFTIPQVSNFGRRSVIRSSFYRRNSSSLQSDPGWYRDCQTGNSKNFNEILTY